MNGASRVGSRWGSRCGHRCVEILSCPSGCCRARCLRCGSEGACSRSAEGARHALLSGRPSDDCVICGGGGGS